MGEIRDAIPGFSTSLEAYHEASIDTVKVTVSDDPSEPIRIQTQNGKSALAAIGFTASLVLISLGQWTILRFKGTRLLQFLITLIPAVGFPTFLFGAIQTKLFDAVFLWHAAHPLLCLAVSLLIYARLHIATERRFCQMET